MGRRKDLETLKMCSGYTEGKADLLIYCLPVSSGSKFHDCDPAIMRSLTEAFGKDHCVLVLTMSNHALLSYEKDYNNQETAAEEYKKYLKDFTTQFEQELCGLQVEKRVKTIFELKITDDITTIIISVPAGKTPHNEVLPGLEYSLPDYCEKNWVSLLIEIIRRKCTEESTPLLLELEKPRCSIQ